MESAIPNHLKCPRTLGRRIDDDYQPPFPAQVARADASLKEVVMGYFGVQTIGDDRRSHAVKGLKVIVQQFAGADGPQYHDLAQYRDADGYDNLIAIAYWKAPDSFKRWHASKPVADWWNSSERLKDGVGYFREVVVAQSSSRLSMPSKMHIPALVPLWEAPVTTYRSTDIGGECGTESPFRRRID
jgi:aldoxime dehydratase